MKKKLSVKPSEYIEIKQHGLVYASAASGDFSYKWPIIK